MRLIGSFKNEKQGRQFSEYLSSIGIPNTCEILVNSDWGSSDYGTVTCEIWIHEEDDLEKALEKFEEFKQNPENAIYQRQAEKKDEPSIEPIIRQTIKQATPQPMGLITFWILLLCIGIFVYGAFSSKPIPESIPTNIPLTPIIEPNIYKKLLYDYPYAFELVDRMVTLYGIDKVSNPSELPKAGLYLFDEYLHTPYWEGIYNLAIAKLKDQDHLEEKMFQTPMFEKITEGEVWRLFTPALLHANILHILFNLIWLAVLGKQMEMRLGAGRYILFILVTGIFSNTVQYLVSGPNFIGISGVLCAMFAFIWMRQRVAAWEAYDMQSGTINFLAFFIGAMFAIQVISFFLEVFKNVSISPGIANAAHLSGILAGATLGRMKFFAWKKH